MLAQPMEKSASILWIDDDAYAIEGLMYSVKRQGHNLKTIESLKSASDHIRDFPEKYDLFIIDMIMPPKDEKGQMPDWLIDKEPTGENSVFLIEYIRDSLKLKTPILLLTITLDPIHRHNLTKYKDIYYLRKNDLTPQIVADTINDILTEANRA